MGLFCPFLCTVVVYCIGSKLCSLGSVVDNSGREQWNSWPEECSLLRCSAGQRRADGLSFYPRVMWSIKPAAVLPWMGRHTPAHLTGNQNFSISHSCICLLVSLPLFFRLTTGFRSVSHEEITILASSFNLRTTQPQSIIKTSIIDIVLYND